MRKNAFGVAAWVVAAFALTVSQAFAGAVPELGRIVSRVNGAPLTVAELNQEIGKILPQNQTFHGQLSADKQARIRVEAMQKLVDLELQAQDARAKGFKIGEAELAAEVQSYARRFKTADDFKVALAGSGFDPDSFSRFVERTMLAARVVQAEVDSRVSITDADTKAYYDKNSSRYSKPTEFRASHILFKVDPSASAQERGAVQARAEAVLKRITAGADFADTASQESDDLTRIKGGDLGYFHAGQAVPEFDEVLTKMKVGEISGVVESIYGYHIVRLTDRKAGRQLSYEEMKDKIKADLVKAEKQRLFDQWMSGLKAKAVITDETRKTPAAGAN